MKYFDVQLNLSPDPPKSQNNTEFYIFLTNYLKVTPLKIPPNLAKYIHKKLNYHYVIYFSIINNIK